MEVARLGRKRVVMDNEKTEKKKNRTSKKAVAKYVENNYDRLELKVPKGKKDIIKAHAEKYQGEVGMIRTLGHIPKGSVNGFINRAIDETIARDVKENEANEKT